MFASSKLISLLVLAAVAAVVSAEDDSVVVNSGSDLSSAEQACLNRAHAWMLVIPTTSHIEALYEQVMNSVEEEDTTGNEVTLPPRSADTTRDCGIYTAIMKAVLMFTQCDDDRTAFEIFNKLLARQGEGDAYLDANQKFNNVFFHSIVCDAHVQTQLH